MLKERKIQMEKFINGKVSYEVPMALRTTFKIGGKAEVFIVPDDESDLAELLEFLYKNEMEYFILGGGSNVLVSDSGIRERIVIHLPGSSYFRKIAVNDDLIMARAGVSLVKLMKAAVDNSLSGLEFLEGIYGSVGGALNMNAGAFGTAIGDKIFEVKVMNKRGKIIKYKRDDLSLGYRQGLKGKIILEVVFKLEKARKINIENKCKEYREYRKETQPKGRSAGCVFKNSGKLSAGKIIEELGLKGLSRGDAYISKKHGNFIINRKNAKAKDVLWLIDRVKKVVKEEKNIVLDLELEIV